MNFIGTPRDKARCFGSKRDDYTVMAMLKGLLAMGRGQGRFWFVDTVAGNNANNGRELDSPFLTMAAAFAQLGSGDTVLFRGNVREQLTTPANVFDVNLIGLGNRPRHADATPFGGNLAANSWRAPASGVANTTPLLKIIQQGWRLQNILFDNGTTSAASVQIYRDAGAGDLERCGGHAEILGCRFQGNASAGVAESGVELIETYNVLIKNCIFSIFMNNANSTAIKTSAGAGVAATWRINIEDCTFHDNKNDIVCAMNNAEILRNRFHMVGAYITNVKAIDLTNGLRNLVAHNYMCSASDVAGTNARFTAGTGDIWGPNYYSDKEEYAEPAE